MNGQRTLVCECKHNTDGQDCDKCLPLFNDVEWRRATSKDVNECKRKFLRKYFLNLYKYTKKININTYDVFRKQGN